MNLQRPVNPATRDVRPPQVHSKVDGSRGKLSMNQTKRQEKRQAIHTAIKRVAVKGSAERDEAPVKPARPFVFVGNLTSTITVPRLQALFAPCGEIIEILVRCSRGKAVTAGGPAQHDALNVRDLWYASMTFRDLPAAEEALTFTGLEIDGRNIVVSIPLHSTFATHF
ncbi:hypothetical protein C0991_006061 [Blastosporella zonata]|nr:hypothetical protein C0991_006061 [Blastosporella zonata]